MLSLSKHEIDLGSSPLRPCNQNPVTLTYTEPVTLNSELICHSGRNPSPA